MDNIQAAVFERMRQAIGRLVRDGAGDALNGEIVLTVRDGVLVDVRTMSEYEKDVLEDINKPGGLKDQLIADLHPLTGLSMSHSDAVKGKQKKPRA